jgi:hypothetical protein
VDNSTVQNRAQNLLQRIDDRLLIVGKSRWWLSMQLTDGKRHGVITDIERKGFIPAEPRLHKMAELLETTTDYLMGRTNNPAQVASEVTLSDVRLGFRGAPPEEPGIPIAGTGDCADLEVQPTDGGDILHIERSSFDMDHAVRYLERPPALRGDRTAYAIYFHGSSMEPRFFAGEVGVVQPSRPAGPGDFVVVQLNDGESDDVITVLVKRLVRQTPMFVELEQYNPPLVFRLPRKKVAHLHRILPPGDLLLR